MRLEAEHLFSIVALCALGLEDLGALLHVSGLDSHVRLWDAHFRVGRGSPVGLGSQGANLKRLNDVRYKMFKVQMQRLPTRYYPEETGECSRQGEGKGEGEDKGEHRWKARIHCCCCTLLYNVAHGQAKPSISTQRSNAQRHEPYTRPQGGA